jgi:hypothetical protein
MLLRNINLLGPFPISRDGKALGSFIVSALQFSGEKVVTADADVMQWSPLAATIRLRSAVPFDITPGFVVSVAADRSVRVTDPKTADSVTIVFPAR